MAAVGAYHSTESLFSLLRESELEIQTFALEQLLSTIDHFWAEVGDHLPELEELFERDNSPLRHHLGLLLSKVYYHLERYEEALDYAIAAESVFYKLPESNEYVQVMQAVCIDSYIKKRQSGESVSTRHEGMMNKLFEELLKKENGQAIGIAIESERLDICRKALEMSRNSGSVCLLLKQSVVEGGVHMDFRNEVLKLLVHALQRDSDRDIISLVECWIYLDDVESCAVTLKKLLEERRLVAYQVAFYLYEHASQGFLVELMGRLGNAPPKYSEKDSTGDVEMGASDTDENLLSILNGKKPTALVLHFLSRNNDVDRYILHTTKALANVKSSLQHSAVTLSHAVMQYGTTNDEFLRSNMEFLSYASNWSKFSATAGLGLVHKGNVTESFNLLSAYLPKDDAPGSAYSESGALLALGLIHVNMGSDVSEYLLGKLTKTQNEIIQHGASLGIGMAALGTGDSKIHEALKAVLFSDSAVAGEAAAYAIGLVNLSSGKLDLVEEMLQYAHDTQHEKIIRALAVSVGLIMLGTETHADSLIEQMVLDKNPLIRYGAMMTIGLSYCATGSQVMLEKLLHVSVSDADDDVRRAAVISIGLLLCHKPDQVPKLLLLLSESFNPHVRYGCALATGIACAGTGSDEAIKLIEPLTSDMVDFVRQAALLALSFILVQRNESNHPKALPTRKLYEKIIADKHEDSMAKFGAVLAQGFIDAGGRNVTMSPMTLGVGKHPNRLAIVGMALFSQLWYWHPMVLFASLAFRPTGLLAVDVTLTMPQCHATLTERPSYYAYPATMKPVVDPNADKMTTAHLSTTDKNKLKATRHEKLKEEKNAPVLDSPFPAKIDTQVITTSDQVSLETREAAGAGAAVPSTTVTTTEESIAAAALLSQKEPTPPSKKLHRKKKDEPCPTTIANGKRVLPFLSLPKLNAPFKPVLENYPCLGFVLVEKTSNEKTSNVE